VDIENMDEVEAIIKGVWIALDKLEEY